MLMFVSPRRILVPLLFLERPLPSSIPLWPGQVLDVWAAALAHYVELYDMEGSLIAHLQKRHPLALATSPSAAHGIRPPGLRPCEAETESSPVKQGSQESQQCAFLG